MQGSPECLQARTNFGLKFESSFELSEQFCLEACDLFVDGLVVGFSFGNADVAAGCEHIPMSSNFFPRGGFAESGFVCVSLVFVL